MTTSKKIKQIQAEKMLAVLFTSDSYVKCRVHHHEKKVAKGAFFCGRKRQTLKVFLPAYQIYLNPAWAGGDVYISAAVSPQNENNFGY